MRISDWSSDVCSSDLVSAQADYRAENIRVDNGGLAFDVEVTDRSGTHAARLDGLHLPMLGRHNALNAIAAIAVAREMGLEEAGIRKALANFGGVKRRFTRTGEAGSIAVIDDYGHHPVERSEEHQSDLQPLM